MRNVSMLKVLRTLQLMAYGAVIGLYAAKAFGLVGVEVTQTIETVGVSLGASTVAILKVFHLV